MTHIDIVTLVTIMKLKHSVLFFFVFFLTSQVTSLQCKQCSGLYCENTDDWGESIACDNSLSCLKSTFSK